MKLIKCLTRRFVLPFCHIVVSLPCFLLRTVLQFPSFLVSIQVIPGETSVTLEKSTLPKLNVCNVYCMLHPVKIFARLVCQFRYPRDHNKITKLSRDDPSFSCKHDTIDHKRNMGD